VTAGTVFHGTKKPLGLWFKAIFLMVTQKNGVSAKTIERVLGVSYPTAWTWLQKLRRVIGKRLRCPLRGVVQVDDAYFGGYKEGEQGRRKGGGSKNLVVVGVEEKESGMGRARLVAVADHSRATFTETIRRNVAPGSVVRTDGLSSYDELKANGYRHDPEVIGKEKSRALELFPHVHQVVGLVKRWVLGTHQGAVRRKHFGVYLEEFTFRFNRRTSRHRTLLFERLVGWGMQHRAEPYWRIIGRPRPNIPLYVGGT
jgi:transposase-like protein